MFNHLNPYPAMKDSGVPGLGPVPKHWNVWKLRHLLRRRTERNRPDLPLLSVVREKGVILRDMTKPDGNHNFIPDDLTNYKVLRAGQFAMNKMKAWQGSYGVSCHDGIVSPAYFVFDLAGLEGGFFHVAIRSFAYVPAFTQASDGVRIGQWDLAEARMREIPFALPPLAEQAAIVRFLDHADGRIRRYIRAKQKLIKLLEEQKQAIIHRAVTRGLDPNVRLKPSCVEWLGDVPEHWEVRRVKQAAQVLRGRFTHRPRNDPSLYDGPYPFIQTGDVARADKAITHYRQTLNERGLTVSRLSPSGTLVMTIAANIGDVAVLDFEACFPDSVVGFIPREGVERNFLYYVFRAMKPELIREAPINTQGNLNVDRIGTRGIAMPSIFEQQRIVQRIEADSAGLTATIDRARREIALLREYRTRLIADVVTGKLDVREAAAGLPDGEPCGVATSPEPDLEESERSELLGGIDDPEATDEIAEEAEA